MMPSSATGGSSPLRLVRQQPAPGDLYSAMRFGLCLIDALLTKGNRLEAISIMLELVRTGMSGSLDQLFIDGRGRAHALLLEMYQNDSAYHDEFRATLARSGLKDALTPRQTVVLRLMGHGFSNKRIARDLQIAPETVKSHAKHIFEKLGAHTRAQAITRAVKLSLL